MSAEGHEVDPADEGRHEPGPERWWNESWYLDWVSEDGTAGYVRLGLHPNQGVAWWTATVVGPDRKLVEAVDLGLPIPPDGATGVAADGTSVDCIIEDPLRCMHVVATSPAALLDEPADVYRGAAGEPTTLDIDLRWRTDGEPHHYLHTTRYEIPCLVEGTIRIGDEELTVVGQGQRDHSWAPRDWWSVEWCWFSARLDDGTRIHGADIRLAPDLRPSFGYVQDAGGVRPITSDLVVEEVRGEHGFPATARITCPPVGLDVQVETVAFAPLLFVDGDRVDHFPRAHARYVTADGVRGEGWIEWNQVQPTRPSTTATAPS